MFDYDQKEFQETIKMKCKEREDQIINQYNQVLFRYQAECQEYIKNLKQQYEKDQENFNQQLIKKLNKLQQIVDDENISVYKNIQNSQEKLLKSQQMQFDNTNKLNDKKKIELLEFEMEQFKRSCQRTIDKLMKENSTLQEQLINAEIEKIQMKQSTQSLSECKDCMKDLQNANVDKETLVKLQNAVKNYEQAVQDMECEQKIFLTTKSQLSETQQSNQILESKLEQKEYGLKKIKEKSDIIEKRLKECQEQIKQFQIQLKVTSQSEDKAKEKIQKYQQQLQKMKENFDKQEKELQNYKASLNEITKKFEEEQQKNLQLKDDFEKEKMRLDEENGRKFKQLSHLNKKIKRFFSLTVLIVLALLFQFMIYKPLSV
ncbi:unnamed protein product [Paramecium pentaurelia]|uniref:Transmembrane protein n=1 Tax=Paramecium pentaurelia TaxID=43138 RepID=A0A8S1TTN9_9CILI|nr:unnamed protein product [Paramecium pentaurelia]